MDQALAHSPASPGSGDVIEPTQLTPGSVDSKEYIKDVAACIAGSYIFESCIPATCLELIPPLSATHKPEGSVPQQHSRQDHSALQHGEQLVPFQQHATGRQQLSPAHKERSPLGLLQPSYGLPGQAIELLGNNAATAPQQQKLSSSLVLGEQHDQLQLQEQEQQQQPMVEQAAAIPVDDAVQVQPNCLPQRTPTDQPTPAAPISASTGNRGRLSLLPVLRSRDQQQPCGPQQSLPLQQQQQQQQWPCQQEQQQWQHDGCPGLSKSAYDNQQPKQPMPPHAGQQRQPATGLNHSHAQPAPAANHWQALHTWQQQHQHQQQHQWQQGDSAKLSSKVHPMLQQHLLQQQQLVQQLAQPQSWAAAGQATMQQPWTAGPLQLGSNPAHQQGQPGAAAAHMPTAKQGMGSGGCRRGPSAAARAYWQQKPFKAPKLTATAGAGAGAGAGATAAAGAGGAPAAAYPGEAGNALAAAAGPLSNAPALLSRPPGTFKPPARQVQAGGHQAAGQDAGALLQLQDRASRTTAGQPAVGPHGAVEPSSGAGFVTGRGGGIAVSAAAQARAAALLQEELGDLVAVEADALAAGTEQADALAAGTEQQVRQVGVTAASSIASAGGGGGGGNPAAVAAAGFESGKGGSIAVTAAAKQRAKALLQEELGPELLQPAGALEQQGAAGLHAVAGSSPTPPAEPSHQPAEPPTAALGGGGGFVTGRGSSICVSAAARARAQQLLQDELGVGLEAAAAQQEGGVLPRQVQQQPAPELQSFAQVIPAAVAGGFMTGRGNSIVVSEAARAKAAALLQDELGAGHSDEPVTRQADGQGLHAAAVNSGSLPGFVTGHGAAISVSSTAAAKGAALVESVLSESAAPDRDGLASAAGGDAAADPIKPGLPQQVDAQAGQEAGSPAAAAAAAAAAAPEGRPKLQPPASVAQDSLQSHGPAGLHTSRQHGSTSAVWGTKRPADTLAATAACTAGQDIGAALAAPQQHGSSSKGGFKVPRCMEPQQQRAPAAAALAAAGDARAQRHSWALQQQRQEGRMQRQQQQHVPYQPHKQLQEQSIQQQQQQQQVCKHQHQQLHEQCFQQGAALALEQLPRLQPEQPGRGWLGAPVPLAVGPGVAGGTSSTKASSEAGSLAAAGAADCFDIDMSLASDEMADLDELMAEAEAQLAARTAAAAAAAAATKQHHAGPPVQQLAAPGLQHAGQQHAEVKQGPAPHQQQHMKAQQHAECWQQPHLQEARHPALQQLPNSYLQTPAAAAGAACEDEDVLVIADSQPDSQTDCPLTTQHQPMGPTWQHEAAQGMVQRPWGEQCAVASASAAGATGAAGRAVTAASTAPVPAAGMPATNAAGADVAPASVSAKPISHQRQPLGSVSSSRQQQPATQPTGALSTAPRRVSLPGRHFWPEWGQQPHGKSSTKPVKARPHSLFPAAAAHNPLAAAVAVPGLQWACGDGVMLSWAALQRGEAFAAQLTSLRLLAPAGSTWQQQREQQPLLVDLLVTAEGRVQLLLGVVPPAPQPAGAGAAVNKQSVGSAAAPQQLGQQQQQQQPARQHQQWQGQHYQQQQQHRAGWQPQPRNTSAGSGSGGQQVRQTSRPPANTSGGAWMRKQRAGNPPVPPKRGSLQHLWGAAASTRRRSGSQQSTPEPTPAAPVASRTAAVTSLAAAAVQPSGLVTAGGRQVAVSVAAREQARLILLEPASALEAPQQQQQQQQQQWGAAAAAATGADAAAAAAALPSASSGLVTASGRQVAVSAAARQQFQQVMAAGGPQQQQQVPPAQPLVHAVSPDAAAAHCSGLVGTAAGRQGGADGGAGGGGQGAGHQALEQQQQQQQLQGNRLQHQQQQQQQQQPSVGQQQRQQQAVLPAERTQITSAGLTTAGGRQVSVSSAAMDAFRQRLGQEGQQQQQQQQQNKQQTSVQQHQQQQVAPGSSSLLQHEVVPQPAAPLPSSGLCTAGGRQVTASEASRQQLAALLDQEKQSSSKVCPQQQQGHGPAAVLSTAGGRRVEVSAAAQQQFRQLLNQPGPQQQQQQQQQQQAGPSGLSTAGGRKVSASAEALQRFRQLMGQADTPHSGPQQHQAPIGASGSAAAGAAGAEGSARVGIDAAGPVAVSLHQEEEAAAAQATPANKGAAGAALASAHTPTAAVPGGAAAAATPAAKPSGGPAFKTPGLPPRIGSRKRSLSHPCTGAMQQQQLQQAVGVGACGVGAGPGDSGSRSARKAFRPPAMTTPSPARGPAADTPQHSRQQAPQTPAGSGSSSSSSAKKPRLQEQPAEQGLALADYFAIARAQQQHHNKKQEEQPAAAGHSSEAAEVLAWVADCLPTTPKAAAAFAFKATQVPASSAAASSSAASACVAAPCGPGAVFGAAEARQALLSWGAQPDKATAAWVDNHFKWVVWKLAAYDRKLLGLISSSSGAGGGDASCCLCAEAVVQQLQSRYTREIKEGQRSVLKKVRGQLLALQSVG